jgi:hypothetical protein
LSEYLIVVYGIEALFPLFWVVLFILIRMKYNWIGKHMSGKRPFLERVGLILRGVLTSEIYGSFSTITCHVRKGCVLRRFFQAVLFRDVVLRISCLGVSSLCPRSAPPGRKNLRRQPSDGAE